MLLRAYNLTMNKTTRSLNIIKYQEDGKITKNFYFVFTFQEDIFRVKYNKIKSLLTARKTLLS